MLSILERNKQQKSNASNVLLDPHNLLHSTLLESCSLITKTRNVCSVERGANSTKKPWTSSSSTALWWTVSRENKPKSRQYIFFAKELLPQLTFQRAVWISPSRNIGLAEMLWKLPKIMETFTVHKNLGTILLVQLLWWLPNAERFG